MYTILNHRPLSPVTLAVLDALRKVAEEYAFEYFLIGATARDILMTHVFGINTGRATRDVDFAIAIEEWSQFDAIKANLVSSGDFQQAENQTHRLYYREDEYGLAYPLDLIPFGRIEGVDNMITWPPDMHVVMSVAGYAEALRTSVKVDVGNGNVVRVVSLPALAVLKLLAWNDRGLQNSKDAHDFYFLLKNYHQAGNADRLYEEASAVLESNNYELELTGAALLGYDANRILEDATRKAVIDVLRDPAKRDRLILHMHRAVATASEIALRFVVQFERGLDLESL